MKLFSRNGLMALLVAGFLAGCGGDGAVTPSGGGGGGTTPPPPPPDPYADSTAKPPATITDPTITAAASIAAKTDGSGLYDINVAGFAAPTATTLSARQLSMRSGPNKFAATRANLTRAAVPDLTANDFVVVEGGIVKGHTVRRIGEDSTRAKADVVFVFDTTGSMSGALTSVQSSIIDFADFLGKSGLDVQLGAVTFGDAFDTKATGSRRIGTGSTQPPAFDSSERQVFAPTTDFTKFKQFISEETATGGNNEPENAIGALQFAFDNTPWRTGAQRVLIVITDVVSHNSISYSEDSISGRWIPPSAADLIAKLKGKAVVHVVSPKISNPGQHTDMKVFAGTEGTGGAYFEWDKRAFSLVDLPIAEVAAGGYVITYRAKADGKPKTLRVVINDGAGIRGEILLPVEY
ncbi:vWA domain-containing protein [Pigmentiphaga sp.]|uniref:vWA domain-containing protein n=1 Tax=Pigmentiphaga sp. TaxID=1977564 RepID=UPI0025E64ED1|nr:vWA domain-containing protein [Pigmentiphaga sp.]